MAETNYQVPNEIANGDDLDATKVMGNFEYIENALNDFNGENITAGTVLDAAFATSPETVRDETLADHIVSGFTSADPGASLTGVIASGIAYIQGVRVAANSFSHAYTASKDCYVDLDKNGSFHVTEVANGAAAPALYTNSTRIGKYVTNGTEITSYTDLRKLLSTSNPYFFEGYVAGSPYSTLNDTSSLVLIDTEVKDPNSNFASSLYTAPVTGFYQVDGQVVYAPNATGTRSAIISVSGTTKAWNIKTNMGAGENCPVNVSKAIWVNAGQTIGLYSRQNSGGGLNVLNGEANTFLSISLITQG